MSFIWPPMLALLVLVPVGVLFYRWLERRRRRRVEASGGLGLGRGCPVHRPVCASAIPAALFLVGLTIMVVALARPQSVVDLPRAGGHGHPRLRRLGEHGGRRPRRRPGMEAAKAATKTFVERQPPRRRDRRRRVQRRRPVGPDADQRPGGGPRRDRPAGAGAGDLARPGHPDGARHDRRRRGRSVGRLLQQPLAANRRPTPTPVPPGTHAPAVIVLLTDGENNEPPGPARRRAGRRRPRSPDLHGRARQRGRDDPRPRRVQGPHPARRGDAPADLRRSPAAPTSAPSDDAALQSVYDNLDTAPGGRAGEDRGHRRCSPARACCSLVVGGLSLAGVAGPAAMTLPVAGPARPARAACRSSSASTSGACAAGGRPGSATRACRLVRDALPGSSRLRRHLPFALFALAVGGARRRARAGRSRS